MNRAEFKNFVDRKQSSASDKSTSFDPVQQLQEWKGYLASLYATIEGFMEPFKQDGAVRTDYSEIQLVEDFSGPYTVNVMSLSIGMSTIVFKPIGTMLIGSKGRVDVQGPRGSARLGLVNANLKEAYQMIRVTVQVAGSPAPQSSQSQEPIEWAWKIIAPAPQMLLIDLSEDAFFDMISSVADA